ncbi:MAG: hypothetical protein WD225_12950 [Ilumatobacteraceae bacterium]
MLTRRVGVVALARDTFDLAEAERQAARARDVLLRLGLDWSGSHELVTDRDGLDAALRACDDELDAMIVLQATFADASMVIDLAARTDRPLVVWSFPEPRTGGPIRLNSLCGANLAAFSLRRRGNHAAFVHVDPTDGDAGEKLVDALSRASLPIVNRAIEPTEAVISDAARAGAREVAATLANAPIGVIGDHPDGFEPCSYDDAAIHALAGVRPDRVELTDLFGAADDVVDDELMHIGDRVRRAVRLTPGLDDVGLEQSLRLYGGMHALATERGWKAMATRCWPECPKVYGGAACAPQAMMTEDGVPAMCEADVYGALTALVLRTIAGRDPFVTDLVDADERDETSAVWHCGQAPMSLADPDAMRRGVVHQNNHRALLHEFPLAPGRVTIARISQAGDGRPVMVIGGGELLARPRPFGGTCGVLRWDQPVHDVMATVFGFGLEHHVALVPGEHRDVLVALADQWGLPVLRLGHDQVHRATPVG